MAAVPQSTLNWLFSVLTKDHCDPRQTYHDPNRTYYDVANALAQYPSLLPRTDVYTYETGFSALILVLTGTLPVSFRGTIYKFPIALWIPNTYPRDPPMAYVTPAQDMAVRVGQHVTLEGRVYHHYLAHWADAWDRSSIVDLLSILREVFAKEPPVKYKQPQIAPPQQQNQMPPPVPPLPPELGPVKNSPVPSPAPVSQIPPPPPPKPGQVSSPEQRQQQQARIGPVRSPAVPPLPPKPQDARRFSHQQPANIASHMNRTPQRHPDQPSDVEGTNMNPRSSQQQPPQATPAYSQRPVYPGASNSPAGGQLLPPGAYGYEQQFPSRMPAQRDLGYYPDYQQPQVSYQHPPYEQAPQTQLQSQSLPPSTQPAPAPKAETPDLLTSPFEVELPSFTSTGPAPPIPPNPEKDALLQAVSRALAEALQSNASQSESAGRSLHSQSQSLNAAVAKLRGEIASLNTLNSTLQSNTSILQQSLHRADGVIAEAQSRTQAPASESAPSGLPPIDEVLVAPTVVGKQLYDLVAEEAGIQQAIYALQAALVKGVIGVEAWSRHTRGLAREAFLKRAVIRKIGRGMGLEEH